MARSTFYYYLKRSKIDKYETVKALISTVFHHHKGRYGYRRIQAELRKEGHIINHKQYPGWWMNWVWNAWSGARSIAHIEETREKSLLICWNETLALNSRIKNGLPMWPSLRWQGKSYTYHPSWTCITQRLSVMSSIPVPTMNWSVKCSKPRLRRIQIQKDCSCIRTRDGIIKWNRFNEN